MGFLWFWRRKPKRRTAALSNAEIMRNALAELGHRQQGRKARRHHTDDFHEVVLREKDGDSAEFSEALLEVTRDSFEGRKQLLDEVKGDVVVPASRPRNPDDARTEAEALAQEIKDDMVEHGISEPEHYYTTPLERAQTGEVDRTYEINELPKRDGTAAEGHKRGEKTQ